MVKPDPKRVREASPDQVEPFELSPTYGAIGSGVKHVVLPLLTGTMRGPQCSLNLTDASVYYSIFVACRDHVWHEPTIARQLVLSRLALTLGKKVIHLEHLGDKVISRVLPSLRTNMGAVRGTHLLGPQATMVTVFLCTKRHAIEVTKIFKK